MAGTSRNGLTSAPISVGRRRFLLASAGLLGFVSVGVPTGALAEAAPDPWPWEPVASGPVAPSAARQDVSIDLPTFRLIVPFRTQKDGGPWQVSNCGPATLGMLLDGFGATGQATDDLRFRAHTYQGTVGMRTGTA